jgi:hypothetical protein
LTIKFAPLKIPLSESLKHKPISGPLVLSFFYPSLSDCQRTKFRLMPETKSSSPSPWFQAQNPTARHCRHFLACIPRQAIGLYLQRLPATPKAARRPLLRLLIPASTEDLYSRNF